MFFVYTGRADTITLRDTDFERLSPVEVVDPHFQSKLTNISEFLAFEKKPTKKQIKGAIDGDES